MSLEAPLMETVIVVALLGAVKHDQAPVILPLARGESVHQLATCRADVHRAKLAPIVQELEPVSLRVEELILGVLQYVLGDGGCRHAKVDLGVLVLEDIRDEVLDGAEPDLLLDAEDTLEDLTKLDVLEKLSHQGHHLHDQVAATVSFAVQLLVLRQHKHHLNHHQPDFIG